MSTARRTSPASSLPEVVANRNLAHVFLSATVPSALRPTVSQRVLQVALIWGTDQVVELQQAGATNEHRSRRAFPLPFTEEVVAEQRRPLFQLLRSGEHVLLVPEGAALRIGRETEWLDLPALVARGEASPVEVPVRGARYVLGLHERLELASGELRVMGRYLRPERAQQTPLGERLDAPFLTRLIIALLVGLAMVGMFRLSNQTGPELDDDVLRHKQTFAGFRPVEPPPRPKLNGGSTASHEGARPRAMELHAQPPGAHQTKHEHDAQMIAHMLRALTGLPSMGNVMNPTLATVLDGLGPSSGSSNETADASGLGIRGEGPGSGGPGVIGIGTLNGRGEHGLGPGRGWGFQLPGSVKPPVLPGGPIQTSDGLAKEVVERIVRRHWNEIKYCYEKELSHDPNLAGKVTVDFEIGPVGDVVKADASESTLGSIAVATCITANVQRWQFPAPSGGGVVEVHYPFLFQSK